MLENILQKLGLTAKEISVYQTLLATGTQPASIVAYRGDLPRNTVRFNLDKLSEKGFVRKSKRGNTQLYSPETPENVIKFLEIKKNKTNQKIDHQIECLKEVSSELQTKMGASAGRPKITFYEGDDGLVKVYEDTLTSSETIRSFANFDTMHGVLPDYFKTYYNRRAKNNIAIRSIHPATKLALDKTKDDHKVMRESTLIPANQYSFVPEVQCYDNKVIITSFKEKLGVIIESKEIYEFFKVAFELAWLQAKQLAKGKKKG